MIRYIFIPAGEITPELEALQTPDVENKETVYHELSGGRYGVLMFEHDAIPEGYEGMTRTQAYNHIQANSIVLWPPLG